MEICSKAREWLKKHIIGVYGDIPKIYPPDIAFIYSSLCSDDPKIAKTIKDVIDLGCTFQLCESVASYINADDPFGYDDDHVFYIIENEDGVVGECTPANILKHPECLRKYFDFKRQWLDYPHYPFI